MTATAPSGINPQQWAHLIERLKNAGYTDAQLSTSRGVMLAYLLSVNPGIAGTTPFQQVLDSTHTSVSEASLLTRIRGFYQDNRFVPPQYRSDRTTGIAIDPPEGVGRDAWNALVGRLRELGYTPGSTDDAMRMYMESRTPHTGRTGLSERLRDGDLRAAFLEASGLNATSTTLATDRQPTHLPSGAPLTIPRPSSLGMTDAAWNDTVTRLRALGYDPKDATEAQQMYLRSQTAQADRAALDARFREGGNLHTPAQLNAEFTRVSGLTATATALAEDKRPRYTPTGNDTRTPEEEPAKKAPTTAIPPNTLAPRLTSMITGLREVQGLTAAHLGDLNQLLNAQGLLSGPPTKVVGTGPAAKAAQALVAGTMGGPRGMAQEIQRLLRLPAAEVPAHLRDYVNAVRQQFPSGTDFGTTTALGRLESFLSDGAYGRTSRLATEIARGLRTAEGDTPPGQSLFTALATSLARPDPNRGRSGVTPDSLIRVDPQTGQITVSASALARFTPPQEAAPKKAAP